MSDREAIENAVTEALRRAMVPVMTKIGQEFDSFRAHLTHQSHVNAEEHRLINKQLNGVVETVDTLWRQVNGSDPPPPKGAPHLNGAVVIEPLDERVDQTRGKVSEHELTIASHQGRLIAMDSEIKETKDMLMKVLHLQERQTQAMGIQEREKKTILTELGRTIYWMVREKEGQKFAASMLAAITGLVTACGTTYALLTGRLPMPTSPAPTHEVP
jgi:hypothetical protein